MPTESFLMLRLVAATLMLAAAPFLVLLAPIAARPTRLSEVADWGALHPTGYCAAAAAVLLVQVLIFRLGLHVWYNIVRPWIAGTRSKPTPHKFPVQVVDCLSRIVEARKDPALAGHYFIGDEPSGRGKGSRIPHYLTEKLRTMHLHVIGATGSGKTASVIAPLALQDILAGKGALWMTFKGAAEELKLVRNFCEVAGRTKDLRILTLEAEGTGSSHTYNPLYVAPRTPQKPQGGNPLAVSERVFAVFKPKMLNDYYQGQANILFRSLVAVLHGMVDERGYSLPFDFTDMHECIRNEDARTYCLTRTVDRAAANDVSTQFASLGHKAAETFTGLQVLVADYASLPALQTSNPDIIVRDALEKNQIIFCALSSNFAGGVSEALGQIILQEMTQAGAERQISRELNQRPFAVFVDEFYNAAYEGIISALNKLRDAKVQMLIAHQTISDLERISKEFAAGVWDNTRTKIVLALSNPVLCETIAKSIGTQQVAKTTSQKSVGPLAIALDAGQQSIREVEEFVLHPNCLKSLATQGQAYLIEASEYTALNLGCIPQKFLTDTPTKPLVARAPARTALGLKKMFESARGQVSQ